MSGERAKRFPLGLADVVREPREPRRTDSRARVTATQAGGAASGAARSAKVSVSPARPARPAAVAPSAQAAALKPLARAQQPRAATKPAAAHGAARPPAPNPKPHMKAHPAPPAGGELPPLRPAAALARAAGGDARRGAPSAASMTGALALTSDRVRERMVERVRAGGVTDPRVLQALATVPRHRFVDAGLAAQAYEDAALPIGHQQTISKPSVVARMLELARNGRELASVLEIGTGCGYQAAVLSLLARDVYSIERVKPLYERAKTNLRPLRIPNLRLHYGDGRLGLPAAAPFDAIVIAAAGLDVPHALLEQLAIGGRLVAPVAERSGAAEAAQVLTLVERTGPAQWRESRLDRVFFVPLKSGVI